VRTREAPEHLKFLVEKIISVAPVCHTIVNYQLLQHLNSLIAVKRQILTVAIYDLAKLL
jgi:hypothetical protein